jgi:tetratricopeptide (TPR) repeat protein/membrane protease YdiL (CAAX protease family)
VSADLSGVVAQGRREASALSWLATVGTVLLVVLFSTFIVELAFQAGRDVYLGGRPGTPPGYLSLIFRTTVSLILQVTILIMVVRISGYRVEEYFRLRLPRKRDIIIGIAATSGLLLLKYASSFQSGGVAILPSELEEYQSASAAGVVPLLFIAGVLVAPLGEELVYRGFLFRGLEASRIGAIGAVLVSTALWAALHFNNGLSVMGFIAILGLLFGWLRVLSQSILLTWLLHALTNLTVLGAVAVQIGPLASEHVRSVAFSNTCIWDEQNEDHARAITDCTEAIRHDNAYARPYANRGLAYHRTGDLNRAIADFDQAIRLGDFANEHERSVVFMNRCGAYLDFKNFARAIEDCTEAVRIDGANAKAYSNRGAAYYQSGDPDHAIADCDQAIRLDPGLVIAFNNRGLAYARKGDSDRALADYNRAIELNPKYAAAFNNRGLLYAGKDDDRAIADYNRAIELNPKFAPTYDVRGLAYARKKDFDRAIVDYNRAIEIDPKNARSYVFRGNAYRGQGYFVRAVADYDQAMALDPKFADAYEKRGSALRAIGDFDRAIADYTEAIRLNPKYAYAYYGRGLAEVYTGALPKAAADLNLSMELNPKQAYVAIWLEMVNKRSDLPSRLQQATAQIDMVKWPAPVIRLYLGEISAADVLAAADDPNSTTKKGQVCEANFYSGELELQSGNKDEATRRFKLAAADCPKTFDEFSAAIAELKALGIRP